MVFSVTARNHLRIWSYLRLLKHFRRLSTKNDRIKLSYYQEKGTFPFLTSTFGDVVDDAANECGDDIGIVLPFQNIRKTFTQFKEETDQLAAGLLTLGLTIGDRIAIYGPNSYQWLLTQYAAAKAGLITVAITPASTEKEVEYIIEKVQCAAVVSAESFKNRDYYKTLCAVLPEIPKSHPGRINSQRFNHLRNIIFMGENSFPGTYKLSDVIEAGDSAARRLLNDTRKKIQFDDTTCILFTSGTTGRPKAAVHSHFQIINQAQALLIRRGFNMEKPVICLQAPVFHAFGNMCGVPLLLLSKGKCVIPTEHFDPLMSLKIIEEEQCTEAYGTPTMFSDMLQILTVSSRKYNLQSWKKVLVGASPVPMELMKVLQEDFGLIVLNGYGATEASGVIASQSSLDTNRKLGSSGKPVEHTEVKIVDKEGLIVPINTDGEVLIRSPFVFMGYWDDVEKTKKVTDSANWYHTGDVGRLDEEGDVFITGRIKEIVIRGGVNIYPTEVENFLSTHPAIAEAYVVGVPDKRLVEELCASIKVKNGCTLTEEEVKTFCKGKISYYKIPRYVLFCKDYPKTASGKIMKHRLKDDCIEILKL